MMRKETKPAYRLTAVAVLGREIYAVRKFLQNYGSVFFSKLLFIFLYLVYNKKRNFI